MMENPEGPWGYMFMIHPSVVPDCNEVMPPHTSKKYQLTTNPWLYHYRIIGWGSLWEPANYVDGAISLLSVTKARPSCEAGPV